jgi:hypothetical protein
MQRLVATIASRTWWRSASKSPTAFLSRTDHNAATPCRVVDVCSRAEDVGDPTFGHHVIARHPAALQARSSAQPVRERSEAEWLDRAEDRRTISCRDGHSLWPLRCSARERRNDRNARVGRQAGGDGPSEPSQAFDSVRSAFTYMNAVSRRNLSEGAGSQRKRRTCGKRHGGALDGGTRQSAVRPDDSDMHLGRERPPSGRAGP